MDQQHPSSPSPPQESPPDQAEIASYDHVEKYANVVDPILQQLRADQPAEVDGYLGTGSDKVAFRAETPHGPVVVKVIKSHHWSHEAPPTSGDLEFIREKTLHSVTPLIRGNGLSHLEQLLSADPISGVLVTSLADGKLIKDMSSIELMSINKSHLAELQTTLDDMKERGLHPHNAGSIFFDKKSGFNFVDYAVDDDPLVHNIGDIDRLEDFIFFALADFKLLDMLANARGMKVPDSWFETTGMRAMVRAKVMRRARQLQDAE
ncbi:MAG: hypothetical protein AAB436_00565 [Patescibacteria group bacterium]